MTNIYILSALISGAFSLVVGFGAVMFKDRLDRKREEKSKLDHESITTEDLETMVIVQTFLEELISKWSIDRGVIYQFHNGGKFLNGISMKKYSLTHEATGPGIEKIKGISQNLFLSNHPILLKKLTESVIYSMEIDEDILDSARQRLVEQGVVQVITVPIRNLNNLLIGALSFYMVKHTVVVTEDMEEDLIAGAQKISGYLS